MGIIRRIKNLRRKLKARRVLKDALSELTATATEAAGRVAREVATAAKSANRQAGSRGKTASRRRTSKSR